MNYLDYSNYELVPYGYVKKDSFGDVLKTGLYFVPGVGTAMTAYDAVKDAVHGNWKGALANAGLTALSFVPGGAIAGGIGKGAKVVLAGVKGAKAAAAASKVGKAAVAAGEAINKGAKVVKEGAGKAGEFITKLAPERSVIAKDIESGKKIVSAIGSKANGVVDTVKQKSKNIMDKALKTTETTEAGMLARASEEEKGLLEAIKNKAMTGKRITKPELQLLEKAGYTNRDVINRRIKDKAGKVTKAVRSVTPEEWSNMFTSRHMFRFPTAEAAIDAGVNAIGKTSPLLMGATRAGVNAMVEEEKHGGVISYSDYLN